LPSRPDQREQIGQLFDAHAAFVWRVLRRNGVPTRELGDGCQEVFLVVHRRFAEFEGRSSVRTWLYAIAIRVAAGMRRKSHLVREQLEAAPASAALQPPEQLEQVARARDLAVLEKALAQLAPEKREVFVLYEIEGMTMAEVARSLSLPENTALYRLYAARAELRAALERRHRTPLKRLGGAKS
jgi:RNA polymerase sigma-70 factor, ECF subfamily